MICKKCGNEIKDGEKFCGQCGVKVNIIQQDPTISGNVEPIKIKFNHLMIFIICIVIFVGIIIVANNNKEQPLESNTNVSSEKSNEQENKKYYDFIDTDYYTFNFTEDELIKGICGGKNYTSLGFQKYGSNTDINSNIYGVADIYGVNSIIITSEPKNFKVKKIQISYISHSNLTQEILVKQANDMLSLVLGGIIFTRDKSYYATEEINNEIQEIANQLVNSTNQTYQGLKFSLEKDMKTINIYLEIKE